MTLGLSHLTDLQRVRLALSDRADGTVLVERSATSGFQLAETVRGGVELPISGGVGQLDDYDFLADAANHYRVTPVDPAPGLVLTGVSGGYASTPDTAVLDITGDLWVAGYVRPNAYAVSNQTIASKRAAAQEAWQLYINLAGNLNFAWWNAGGTLTNINGSNVKATTGVADGEWIALAAELDVDNGASGRTLRLWYAQTLAGPWTQLGSDHTAAGVTTVRATSAPVEVGSHTGGTLNLFVGRIGAVEVRSGDKTGTVVANPDFSAQAHRDTSFTDAAGRTWTVNGDAEIEGFETDSITPTLGGKVWLKSIRWPLGNLEVRVADYSDIEIPSRASAFPVEGRALPTGVFELGGGRDHTLILRTTDQATVDHIMMLVRTGDWFFVHVPTTATGSDAGNTLLPGSMHVMIGTPRVHRIGGVSDQHLVSLPLTEVTPPGPDVVGTTLTVGGLVALHGSVSSVWAAYPTLRDVWDTIGSLGDLIVP